MLARGLVDEEKPAVRLGDGTHRLPVQEKAHLRGLDAPAGEVVQQLQRKGYIDSDHLDVSSVSMRMWRTRATVRTRSESMRTACTRQPKESL